MSVKKQYNTIDFFKFVMALCVVTIHSDVIDVMESEVLRRIDFMVVYSAVHFFFIVSSYFLSTMDYSKWGGISSN